MMDKAEKESGSMDAMMEKMVDMESMMVDVMDKLNQMSEAMGIETKETTEE